MKSKLLCLVILVSFPPIAGAQEVFSVQLVGDEAVLARIQAESKSFLGRPFVLTGGISVSTYYNYGYGDADTTHYSFRFQEVIKSSPIELGGDCHLYLRRSNGTSVIDSIIEKSGGSPSKLVVSRVKAILNPNRFEGGSSSDLFELIDIQFYSKESSQWSPWVFASVEKRREAKAVDEYARAEKEYQKRKLDAEVLKKQEQLRRAQERTRTWKDVSGSFSVEAEFKGMLNSVVRLKRVDDGKEVAVDIERLSDEDKDWIKRLRSQ